MSADDDQLFVEVSTRLADALVETLPAWVERRVVELHDAWAGATPPEVVDAAGGAGREAAAELRVRLDALFALDLDQQRANPLQILREMGSHPAGVLRSAGVPEVVRDADAERLFPDDVYDLGPASFADIDPDLHELGLVWGAAKAKAHLARRRAAG